MQEGRKLKALVIHDTHFIADTDKIILGTEDLTLSPIEFKTGRVSYVLRNWVEVINVLGGLTGIDEENGAHLETPDLMLVDCHFNLDPNSPKLVSGDEEVIDPRGLLYGAVLAAHFLGAHPRRPFAFVPYSMDMTLAGNDPYAQTFYSLLSAMLDPAPDFIEPIYYSRAMEETPASQTPDLVVSVALQRFRKALSRVLTDPNPAFVPDPSPFERALTATEAFLRNGQPIPEDLSLTWSDPIQGISENVLLRSLFADCRQRRRWIRDERERQELSAWGSVEGQEMVKFLQEIVDGKNFYKDVLYPTQQILERVKHSEEPPDWGTDPLLMKQRKTLGFAIAWALDRCEAKHKPRRLAGVTGLGMQLNIPPESVSTEINRALGAVLGLPDKEKKPHNSEKPRRQGSEVLKILDSAETWPFPHTDWLRQLLVSHLVHLHEEDVKKHGRPYEYPHLAKAHWPPCLK